MRFTASWESNVEQAILIPIGFAKPFSQTHHRVPVIRVERGEAAAPINNFVLLFFPRQGVYRIPVSHFCRAHCHNVPCLVKQRASTKSECTYARSATN